MSNETSLVSTRPEQYSCAVLMYTRRAGNSVCNLALLSNWRFDVPPTRSEGQTPALLMHHAGPGSTCNMPFDFDLTIMASRRDHEEFTHVTHQEIISDQRQTAFHPLLL